VLDRLIGTADILLTNFRPEALAAMGVDDETLLARHPGLIYASATGWGRRGPNAGRMMVDGAAQARGGLASLVGGRDGPPALAGALVADTAGAMHLALAVLTALVARERHGVGQRVDVAALGSVLWLQAWELTHASLTGFEPTRCGPHHAVFGSSYGVYQTADGGAVFVGQIVRDDDWVALCAFAGRLEVAADERWATTLRRIGIDPAAADDDAALQEVMAEMIRAKPRDEWMAFFDARPDTVAEPVRSTLEVLDDPQVRGNDFMADIELPGIGPAAVLGPLVGLTATPGAVRGGPPGLGADTDDVLRGLGYDDDVIGALATESQELLARRFGSLKFQPPADAEAAP
jgi:crotonobetainyl-CoA:carnitine CoA-transferase CaiB-like acyl-CoA transferase